MNVNVRSSPRDLKLRQVSHYPFVQRIKIDLVLGSAVHHIFA